LGEIESCLLAHPAVKSCIVVVREDAGGKRLVAYLVGDESVDIRDYLREKLPPPMIPSAIMFLERLPLSPNGKIDRRALPDPGVAEQTRETFEAPVSNLERRLLEHFRAAVRSSHFQLQDDFFESGGDSLGAMDLAAKASAEGLSVTVRDILRHRTVRAIAEALGRSDAAQRFAKNPPEYLAPVIDVQAPPVRELNHAPDELRAASALLPFREHGNLPPLFFVHPAGGSAVSYRHLAGHLPDQPFYGLECVDGYAGKGVESMAREYLAEVRRVQPKGPYFLGGWSFGGNVAFEMARQLESEPDENQAALVILVDSRPLTHPTQYRFISEMTSNSAAILCLIGRHFAQMTGHPEPVSYQALRAAPDAERNERFLEAVEKAEMFPRHMAGEFVRRFIDDFDVCMHMLAAYRLAGQRRVDVLLLRASEVSRHYEGFPAMEEPLQRTADPSYGWDDLTLGRVMVRTVPGTHETCVFPPNVSSVASHIRAEMGRRIGAGRHFDALPSLTATQWSTVLNHAERRTVTAGGLLIEEGAIDREVYLVASGLLEVLVRGSRIAESGAGTVLGEVAFIDGSPRTASVRALSEVTAFSLTPASFERLTQVAPDIALVILGDLARTVAQRFRAGQEKMRAAPAAI
jgi:thioesterase domain-containing protein